MPVLSLVFLVVGGLAACTFGWAAVAALAFRPESALAKWLFRHGVVPGDFLVDLLRAGVAVAGAVVGGVAGWLVTSLANRLVARAERLFPRTVAGYLRVGRSF